MVTKRTVTSSERKNRKPSEKDSIPSKPLAKEAHRRTHTQRP